MSDTSALAHQLMRELAAELESNKQLAKEEDTASPTEAPPPCRSRKTVSFGHVSVVHFEAAESDGDGIAGLPAAEVPCVGAEPAMAQPCESRIEDPVSSLAGELAKEREQLAIMAADAKEKVASFRTEGIEHVVAEACALQFAAIRDSLVFSAVTSWPPVEGMTEDQVLAPLAEMLQLQFQAHTMPMLKERLSIDDNETALAEAAFRRHLSTGFADWKQAIQDAEARAKKEAE